MQRQPARQPARQQLAAAGSQHPAGLRTSSGLEVARLSSSSSLIHQPGPAAHSLTSAPLGLDDLMSLLGAASTLSLRRRRNALSGWQLALPAEQPVEQIWGNRGWGGGGCA